MTRPVGRVTSPAQHEDGRFPTTTTSNQPPTPKDTKKEVLRATLDYSYIGIFFGVAIAIGYFGGNWVDGRWQTKPWGGLVGVLLGVVTGFRELYRIAKKYQRQNK